MIKKKIKVLFGLEASSGGALKHVLYLCNHLNKESFEITLMCSPRSVESENEIIKLKSSGIRVVTMHMPTEISLLKDLVCLVKIISYIHKTEFDIVHSHSSKAGFYFRIASWLNRVPVAIYTPHCFYFQSLSGLKRSFFELIERLLGFLTDILIVSENEKKAGIQSKIVPPSKLVNINNAIDFNDYRVNSKKSSLDSLGLSEDSFIIGSVGRLVNQKDFLTLICAAHRLVKDHPNLYFIIAGSGPLNNVLRKKIAEFKISEKVLLMGHQYDIGNIYSAIDIFVSTSLWEGLPYVVLEAMWYEKAIVATDLGYGDVLADDVSGYIVSPGHVDGLCEKLNILIANKQLCDRFGERNRKKVKSHFSFEQFITLHEEQYFKFCSNITPQCQCINRDD